MGLSQTMTPLPIPEVQPMVQSPSSVVKQPPPSESISKEPLPTDSSNDILEVLSVPKPALPSAKSGEEGKLTPQLLAADGGASTCFEGSSQHPTLLEIPPNGESSPATLGKLKPPPGSNPTSKPQHISPDVSTPGLQEVSTKLTTQAIHPRPDGPVDQRTDPFVDEGESHMVGTPAVLPQTRESASSHTEGPDNVETGSSECRPPTGNPNTRPGTMPTEPMSQLDTGAKASGQWISPPSLGDKQRQPQHQALGNLPNSPTRSTPPSRKDTVESTSQGKTTLVTGSKRPPEHREATEDYPAKRRNKETEPAKAPVKTQNGSYFLKLWKQEANVNRSKEKQLLDMQLFADADIDSRYAPVVSNIEYDTRYMRYDESPYGVLDQLVRLPVMEPCKATSNIDHLEKVPDPLILSSSSSLVGPRHQARVCKTRDDYFDKRNADYLPEAEMMWDSKLAADAERRGEDIDSFLSGNHSLDLAELRITILHSCNYCVSEAKSELQRITKFVADDHTLSFAENKKFTRLIGSERKNFAKVSKKMRRSPRDCMIHYYNWKRTHRHYSKLKLIWKNDFCSVCDDGGDLIVCDSCDAAFHLDCMSPPLKKVPTGAWHCPACEQARESARGNRVAIGQAPFSPRRHAQKTGHTSADRTQPGIMTPEKHGSAGKGRRRSPPKTPPSATQVACPQPHQAALVDLSLDDSA